MNPVEMTARGKMRKSKNRIFTSSHRPWKSLTRFPHSHRLDHYAHIPTEPRTITTVTYVLGQKCYLSPRAEDTARAIQQGRWSEIDHDALADEVLGLSKSEKYAIASMFEIWLTHLLMGRYQPEKKSRGWENAIAIQRLYLAERFEDNPSLRPQAGELMARAYRAARLAAANETGLEIGTFPEVCEWTVEALLG